MVDTVMMILSYSVIGQRGNLTIRYTSSDSSFADDGDILFFVGHGLGGCFAFTREKDQYLAYSSDMSLGDEDAEWLFAFTCNFTNPNRASNNYSERFDPDMMAGIQVVCGYRTDMTITADSGELCADYLTGYGSVPPMTVIQSWRYYGIATQPGYEKNTQRIWFADDCEDDYIWGHGSHGSEPDPYSESPLDYSYVDYKLNWQ